ncbi:hypothetical protein HYW55_05020 [Candidatus Gottesmanbacteria bacterium]|nr:hypothetical protein [Candidatus Gottesmanbacteria bacterium]
MHRYFFILGRYPSVSLAELKVVIKTISQAHVFEHISSEAVICRTEKLLPIPTLIERLGGIVKAGEIYDEVHLDARNSGFESIFSYENITAKYLPNIPKKTHLGISLYDVCGNYQLLKKLQNNLQAINFMVKDNLKKKGIRVGFLRVKERYLTSVSVVKNGLLRQGVEIALFLAKDSLLAGKTYTVQDFEKYSQRDIGRPYLDKKSGILPTKLARMLVNLADMGSEEILLDPFCGSGTILQEALLLGHTNILGSDKSQKAIEDTKRNISWLQERYPQLLKKEIRLEIFLTDVVRLSARLSHQTVDAIVTEPYLGPPMVGKPDTSMIQKIQHEISLLYTSAFVEFSKIVKKNGKVIIIFPAFFLEGKRHFLPILSEIRRCGFVVDSLLEDSELRLVGGEQTGRNSLLYGSKGQFVFREIVRFIKTV